jgi:hypothetical protein
MKNIGLLVVASIVILSCGTRDVKDQTIAQENKFVGSWQYKDNSCQTADDCACIDAFSFYSDGKFDRVQNCKLRRGYFSATSDRLTLDYTGDVPQNYGYFFRNVSVLTILRSDNAYDYIKKPFKVQIVRE